MHNAISAAGGSINYVTFIKKELKMCLLIVTIGLIVGAIFGVVTALFFDRNGD
jgi:hypothetical protein